MVDSVDLDQRLREMRPRLHRYCARMTGSVLDGEDVVQDALLKATAALGREGEIANFESWLFRIAHNTAIDFLRRRARNEAGRADEDPDMFADDERRVTDPEIVEASLATFLRLPAAQRSAVILMDVLGYRLQEISAIIDMSLPAVKSALHRGRAHLREFSDEATETTETVALSPSELARLQTYVERFNAQDFDAIRAMLADDVKLDLVNKVRWHGRAQVATYFSNYAGTRDWVFALGRIEGKAGIVVSDPADPTGRPAYFILLTWDGDRVETIRDFRYARYAVEAARIFQAK